MYKLFIFFCFAVFILPSCKKNNGPAQEVQPAGINLNITRQRTVPELKLYKYDGLKITDSATITPNTNRIFFIDHKWLNKNKLRIVNHDILMDEEVVISSYAYNLIQQNNNITESLIVNFTFMGTNYIITETKRIAELVY